MVWSEAEINVLNGKQAAHHQASAYQQDNRKRDLRYDQSGSQLAVARGGIHALAGILQPIVQFAAYGVKRGGQSAEQGRDHGHANRKEQHAQVQRDDRF